VSHRIALCMIVKDEARFLARCLESVRGAVDEIIVVDTGSRDDSVAIARRAGAVVLEHAWTHDFAAARNFALAATKADFVLQLDADEELAKGAAKALRAAIKQPVDAWLLRLHHATRLDADRSAVVAGHPDARVGDEQNLPRLFRRDARYSGAIHEDIGEWLHARGGRLGHVDADIVHWGRTAEVVAEKGKAERNQSLLRKAAADEPGLLYHGYLATELLDCGKPDEAHAIAEEAFARLERGVVPPHHSALRVALVRIDGALRRGELAKVVTTVQVVEAREGSHRDLQHLLGEGHLAAAIPVRGHARARNLARAITAFGAAIDKAGVRYAQAFVSGAGHEASHTQRGVARLLAGDPAAALADFERALVRRPKHRPAWLGKAEALVSLDRAKDALSLLDGRLDETPDAWVVAAAALERLGAIDDMAACLRAARERVSHGYVSPHRRRLHLDRAAALSSYQGQPIVDDSPMGVLGALLSRRPHAAEASGATFPDARRLLDPLLPNLLALGRGDLAATLFEPRARALVPGIVDELATLAARRGWNLGDDGEEPAFCLEGDPHACDLVAKVLGEHPAIRLAAFGTKVPITVEPVEGAVSVSALFTEPRRTLSEICARFGVPFHEAPLRAVLTQEVES